MPIKRVTGERGEVCIPTGSRTARVIPVDPDVFRFGGNADKQALRRSAIILGLRATFKPPKHGPGTGEHVIAVLRPAKSLQPVPLKKSLVIAELLEKAAEVMTRFMRIRPRPGPSKKQRQAEWAMNSKLSREERRLRASAFSQAELAYALGLRQEV